MAAECLLAYRHGQDTEEALVGAALEAEFYGLVRGFLVKK